MKIALFLSSLWLALSALFSPVEKAFLTGKITGDKGEVLIGATVKILKNRESVKGTTTNTEGKYRLEIEAGIYDVEVSCSGYVGRRITDVQGLASKENALASLPTERMPS